MTTDSKIDAMAREYADKKYPFGDWAVQADEHETSMEAYKAGYLAAQPKVSTEVPTEPGAYWVKEPDTTKWMIVTTVNASGGRLMFFAVDPAFWYYPQPRTLWCRIQQPEDV